MSSASGSCATVGTGGVGESGSTSLVTHRVTALHRKMIVLRVSSSSLCANTGVLAVLAINGNPVAFGRLSGSGDTLQAEVGAGDNVVAIMHAIPLFNGISCVRLGELSFVLQECELERLADDLAAARSSGTPTTRDWYAWNNLMPPKPDVFHLVGEVQVMNPGVDVLLVPRIPQGINPRVLLIDLIHVQQPGIWPQVVVWKQARYEKVNMTYDQVQVFSGLNVIADLPVDIVQ